MKPFITIATILITSIIAIVGCKSNQHIVNDTLPLWLQEKVSILNEYHSEVIQYDMNGETYYSIFVKGPDRSYDMYRTTIYDADGNEYLSLGGLRRTSDKERDFFEHATPKGILWQSDVAKENRPKVITKELQPTTDK